MGGAWGLQHGTCAHLRWCAVLAQTRCLRKWHEDALWCLEHHKYAKQQLVEMRDALRDIGRAEEVKKSGAPSSSGVKSVSRQMPEKLSLFKWSQMRN